jgi:AraC-like DNA-binding protein
MRAARGRLERIGRPAPRSSRMTAPRDGVIHTVHERRPQPPLAHSVVCTWIQTVSPRSTPFTHRTAPNGSLEIVCVPGSMPRILGPRTGPAEHALAPGTTIVGVRLRPEAAASVLGIPAPALLDLEVDADELWGDRAHALQELVGLASSGRQAAARLERAVAGRLAGAPAPDPVVAEAVQELMSGRRADVAATASSLFISERQLRRRFESATGLTPSTLHRILRFQRFIALAWLRARPSTQVGELAVEAGYADHAHLSREAARLEGRPPRSFLSESEVRCGCDHDHSASYAPLLRHRKSRLLTI